MRQPSSRPLWYRASVKRTVQFSSGGGGVVHVEVEEPERHGQQPATAARAGTDESFEMVVGRIEPILRAFLGGLANVEFDDLELQLGVKFTPSGEIILAASASEGVRITLRRRSGGAR
jgi:hypothetical protein